jgi:hypothetical protein
MLYSNPAPDWSVQVTHGMRLVLLRTTGTRAPADGHVPIRTLIMDTL